MRLKTLYGLLLAAMLLLSWESYRLQMAAIMRVNARQAALNTRADTIPTPKTFRYLMNIQGKAIYGEKFSTPHPVLAEGMLYIRLNNKVLGVPFMTVEGHVQIADYRKLPSGKAVPK